MRTETRADIALEPTAGLEPDGVVLTEYVADESHRDFLHVLKDAGLARIESSLFVPGQNQVLIASRWDCDGVSSNPPQLSRATAPYRSRYFRASTLVRTLCRNMSLNRTVSGSLACENTRTMPFIASIFRKPANLVLRPTAADTIVGRRG